MTKVKVKLHTSRLISRVTLMSNLVNCLGLICVLSHYESTEPSHVSFSLKHQCSGSVFLVGHLEAPSARLVFGGAFSSSATLHCAPRPFDLSLRRQPGIDLIMGLNDSLGCRSEEGCRLQNTSNGDKSIHKCLHFPLLFLALFVFVSDISGCPFFFFL